ncbi:hypothetical protein [Rhodoferax sp. GW822-FHT02A01]|uniref:hypothetical protein n=1 Tax=Rhodoferax sp. GW822-FHT02A01 TaxID=3141537 RepID=UPI00315DCBDD
MAKISIQFEVDPDALQSFNDQYITQLWHICQANPAPYGDPAACQLAEHVGREIIRRFVSNQHPALWTHQGSHVVQRKFGPLQVQSSVDSSTLNGKV